MSPILRCDTKGVFSIRNLLKVMYDIKNLSMHSRRKGSLNRTEFDGKDIEVDGFLL